MKTTELRLSLKRKWFDMTKPGIKPEDYREINEYWVKRLIDRDKTNFSIEQIVRHILNYQYYGYSDLTHLFNKHGIKFKHYNINTMTLGYPAASDKDRVHKREHKGIEIRTGNPEWGAEPGKIYFVIMHGDVIND